MKNIGLVLLLSSAIIYSSTLISTSIYSQVIAQEGIGWDSQFDFFGIAFREVGIIPIIIAVLLAIVGLILVIRSKD